MSRYSPIAPITLLEEMYGGNILGDYLLLLSHDVLEEPIRYENLILQMRDDGPEEPFIIMDNSVVELGAAMSANDVIEAASVVEASCIMTPDAMGSYEGTVALLEDQAEELQASGFPLMRVPQGNTYEELAECIDWVRDYLPAAEGEPEYWGVPRWIANRLGSRLSVIPFIKLGHPEARIHLLGMSHKFVDDIVTAGLDQVMGIDSANPLVMGQAGKNIDHHVWVHMPRDNYWDDTELTKETVSNIHRMRSLLDNA